MPWILKLKSKPKPKVKKVASDKTKERQKYYQIPSYRKWRDNYIQSHPLCERCLSFGLTTPARDLHHIDSISEDGISEEVKLHRLTDINNVIALCRYCHNWYHHNTNKGQDLDYQDRIRRIQELNGNKDKGNNSSNPQL